MPIYVVQGDVGGPVKIGFATDVSVRIRKMQSDYPHQLKVVLLIDGGIDREKEIHAMMREFHIRGEWFQEGAIDLLRESAFVRVNDIGETLSKRRARDKGHPLVVWMKKEGVKLRQLSEMLGRSKSAVSRWTTGRCMPNIGVMQQISDVTHGAVQPNDWREPAK